MNDPLAAELSLLSGKLKCIQDEFGGPALKKQQHIGDDGKVDRFLELKEAIEEQVEGVRTDVTSLQLMEKQGATPKDIVEAQNRVRINLTQLNDDWRELDNLYQIEAKKRRTKYSAEEMASRQYTVSGLNGEIQSLKEIQRAAYIQGYRSIQLQAPVMNTMADSDMFKGADGVAQHQLSVAGKGKAYAGSATTSVGARNNNMTSEHRVALAQIKQTDAEIDVEIGLIGEGVEELGHIARLANEEVKQQNAILTDLDEKMGDVKDKVLNINSSLKIALDERRSGDKVCAVRDSCIVVAVAVCVVMLYMLHSR